MFYIELCSQIKKRFHRDDSKLEMLKYCKVAEIVSGRMPSIRQLLLKYPFQKRDVSMEILNN